MSDCRSGSPHYVLGPDIDLDVEDVRRPDGTRLTKEAARELGRRGRPAVDPEAGPGERSSRVTFRVPEQTRRQLQQRARDQGRPVADVVREAVEQYLSR